MSLTEGPGSFETERSESDQKGRRQKALQILARMIVRAYLGEIDRGEAGPTAYQKAEMELKDANNKSYRSRKASQHGENKVENQEGER